MRQVTYVRNTKQALKSINGSAKFSLFINRITLVGENIFLKKITAVYCSNLNNMLVMCSFK